MTRSIPPGLMRGLAAMTAVIVGVPLVLAAAYPPEQGRAVVATDHRQASEAGVEILSRGGNAVDAAVAAALAAGVVQPAGSGLGGGGFALVVPADGEDPLALDFREVAPSAAGPDLYRAGDGTIDRQASRVGGLAVAVPGEGRGLARLLSERGTLSPAEVVRPAYRHAAQGFVVGAHLAKSLAGTDHPAITRLFTVGGRVAGRDVRIRNPALARTLRAWADTGGEDLYTGASAAALVASVQDAGGTLVPADLAGYQTRDREPVVATFGAHTLVSFPPPSSGGIALAQILGALDGVDLAGLGHNSSVYLHRLTEAMKHAFADRAHHLGDPDFAEVPRARLLSDARVGEIRGAFDPETTLPTEVYGPRIAPPRDGGTQHISVIDADGNAVALTSTINTAFGSGVVPEALGLPLNNEMDDFSAAPGVPNTYGLVGTEANAIAAGKRPLSSMTPTVVLDADGRPVMALGASGGSTIISSTVQVYLNLAVFDMDPQAAVSAPRIHHQWLPESLFVEPEIPVDVREALEARGHSLDVRPGVSAVQAVVTDADGTVRGGSDPRKAGRPAALRGE